MNKTTKIMGVIFLAMLGTVLCAGALSAEDIKGSITLPFETRWGTAVLPAGEYTFQIDDVSYVVTIRGENHAAMVLSPSRKTDTRTRSSSLLVARRGRKGTVRALFLAEQQLAFNYPPPKGEPTLLADGPELLQRIPILLASR